MGYLPGIVAAGGRARGRSAGLMVLFISSRRNGFSWRDDLQRRDGDRSAPSRRSGCFNHDHHPRGAGINRG